MKTYSFAAGLTLIALALVACVMPIKTKNGAVYTLIVGAGVVVTPAPDESGVLATQISSLGGCLSDQPGLKFNLGYASCAVIAVPDGAADVRVELSKKPWGPVKLESQRVEIDHPSIPIR